MPTPPTTHPAATSPDPGPSRGSALGGAAALVALALAVSVLRRGGEGGRPETAAIVVASWVASVLAGTAAVFAAERRPGAGAGTRAGRALLPLVALVVAVGFAARLVRLDDVPWVLDGDAALFASQALDLYRDGVPDPFGYSTHAYPVPSIALGGLGMLAFGPTIAAARLAWGLVGGIAVAAAWLLFRRLLGPRAGLAATALLATWHFHVHYSRIGLNNVADTLLLSLVVLFVVRARRSASARDWWCAGAASGLGLAGYIGAWIAPLLLLGLAAVALARAPRAFLARHGLRPLAAAAAFLLVAAPMLQWALRRPDDVLVRPTAVGILETGRLAAAARSAGVSVPRLVLDQVAGAGLAFNATVDRDSFYALPSPLLDPVTGLLFLLGLGHATVLAVLRRGGARLFPLVAWWWSGMLLGGVLTTSPPSSQRLVGLAVPTAAFAVSGASLLLRGVRRLVGIRPGIPLALGVTVFAAVSLRTYAEFTPLRRAGGPNSEFATAVGRRVASLRDRHVVYVAGAPRLFASIPPLPFLLRGGVLRDVVDPLRAPPPPECVPEGAGAVFAFTPERRDELAWLTCTFPEGRLEELRRPVDDAPVATLWIVSPGQAAAARARQAPGSAEALEPSVSGPAPRRGPGRS